MSAKTYLNILRAGVLIAPICFFFVFKNLLFPFITSKQIPFNILMEVMFVFWLAFILKYPQYNPFKQPLETRGLLSRIIGWPMSVLRKIIGRGEKNRAHNSLTIAIMAFFGALLASLAVTVDFNLSMWGDVERMLGIFHLLHFLVYYLIIITVMRDWRDWRTFFLVLFLAAFGVSLPGLNGDSKSTIGNNAYVAALLLFGFYFAFFLFSHDEGEKNRPYRHFKWLYFLAFPSMIFVFDKSDTTGALVGLAVSVLFFIFLFGLTSASKKIKIGFLAAVIILIGGVAYVFTHKYEAPFNKFIILKQISFEKNTFQTRLISWRAAAKDFQNHWLLGVGHGNYAIIFDKYFKASFYDYSRGETYFDRAHNNLVDIASTTGVAGLATYLSIFVVLTIYIIRAFLSGRLKRLEFCFLSSLLVAYFVQNLVVFDSFVTYICFMAVLGYVHWLANTSEEKGNGAALLALGADKETNNREIGVLVFAGLAMLFVIYNYNILPLKMLKGTIDGQIAFGKNDIRRAIDVYRQALKYDTILDRDGRSMLIRSVTSKAYEIAKMNQDDVKNIFAFTIEQAEKNAAYNDRDSLTQMELSRLYDAAARAIKDSAKSQEYAMKAMAAIDRSISLSPERIPVHFIKAQFLVGYDRIGEAISDLEYASTLNKNYFETFCQLGQIYLIKAGESKLATSSRVELEDKGFSALGVCLDHGGGDFIVVKNIIGKAINYYAEKQDLDKVIQLYEQLTMFEEGRDTKVWINLAKLYAQAGRMADAEKAALNVAKIDKSLEKDVQEFINQLKNQK